MLQKEFFQVQPFNPNPYWDPVIVNLSGAQKFEEDTVFKPGRYKIEVAPGAHWGSNSYMTKNIRSISTEENILVPFIVRAYCGSNATQNSIGTNPYVGEFKVNGNTVDTPTHGVDVNHIFGAGGGNSLTSGALATQSRGGGNCLGNGSISTNRGNPIFYAAGSCLHLLPVGGTFGTDYIRAYHFAPYAWACGGAYGGGMATAISGGSVTWGYRGGDSPYGAGATTNWTAGGGIGGGGQLISGNYVAGGAYFDGSNWQDAPYDPNNSVSSIIRITYLGPLY